MSLTEISINRPSLIIVIFTVLIGGGIFAYSKLPYELMPEMSQPTLVIATTYPGAAPVNVEQTVTKKIEDVLSGVDGLKDITSQSMEGNSIIIAEFADGININDKQQDVQRKISNIMSNLPSEVKTPSVSKISPSDQPIMQMIATSNLNSSQFYDLMKNEIVPQIQQIAGVGEVNLVGGQEREIKVNVNKNKLDYYGLSILNVSQAINNANVEFPAGKVKSEAGQMTVRLTGKFTSIEQLNDLVIKQQKAGSTIKLSDVASVGDIAKDISSIFRYNGINGVGMLLKKQGDANAVDISKQVKLKIAKIQEKYANSNVKIIVADDTADYTLEAVDGVVHDLAIAVLLVAAIMLLFLHSIRDSLIVLVAIPTSLISTFIAMYFFGYTLNLMTLLALSLVIGILVDDSIVVLENIHRHLLMGKDKRTAALDGRNEIGFSAMAITMVDVVVFSPLAMVNGIISAILRPYALTIVIATLMSLFVCYTLTPWLASRFGKITVLNKKNPLDLILIYFEKFITGLTNTYISMLEFVLKHKVTMMLFVISLFFGIVQVMKMGVIGNEFVTESDKGQFRLALEFDKNTTVLQNNIKTREIENYLRKEPDITTVFSNIAAASTSSLVPGVGSDYKSEMTVTLVDKKERTLSTSKLMLQKALELNKKFAGVKISPQMVNLMNSGKPIQIILKSENKAQLMAVAEGFIDRIAAMPGAINVSLSVEDGNPEAQIDINREQMAQLGLNINSVGATMQNAFAGNSDAKYRVGTNEYDINIKFDDFDKRSVEDVKNITFTNNQGQNIKLSQFASVVQGNGPSVLERKDRRTSVTVQSDILGTTSGVLAELINKSLIEKPLPAGVDYRWTGDVERQGDSFGAMGYAIIAAIVLMYLVMVALYNNFIYPFVVLFSIPVSFLGALLALALTKSSMSVFTILGMIMLLGLVAKNAILIVDFANHRKEHGDKTWTALIEAGKTRLRPILMTTLAMVIGMMPIAFSTSAGSEWKNGLGWVLIGGLSSSLILTIFIVPVVYYSVDRIAEKFGRSFDDKNAETSLPNVVSSN